MPLTPSELVEVAKTSIVSGVISDVVIVVVSAMIVALPPARSQMSCRLVLYLCLSDLIWITSAVYGAAWTLASGGTSPGIVPSDSSGTYMPEMGCVVSGFFMQFGATSSDMWTIAISVFLCITVVFKHEPWDTFWFNDITFVIIVYGITGVVASLPFFGLGGGYGNAGGTWCWIHGQRGRWIFGFTFHWGAVFFMGFFYIWALIYFVKSTQQARRMCTPVNAGETRARAARIKLFKSLAPFPVAYALILIPSTVNRLQGTFNPDNPRVGLFITHALIVQLEGAINALLYGGTHFTMLKEGLMTFSLKNCFSHWGPHGSYQVKAHDPMEVPFVPLDIQTENTS
ncbi:hypothetical protein Pelo_4598 [Pelomyxa schiedti]|nr:hypothetical protein Pelo_4598 [Pelomyxa schiedti]